MTRLSTEEVRGAIEELETAFTYDPPNRWIDAYRTLCAVARELEHHLRPYSWIAWLFAGLGFAWLAFMLTRVFTDPLGALTITGHTQLDVLVFLAACSLPGPLIAVGNALALRLAARRYPLPLLRLKSRIEAALRRVAAFPSVRSPRS